MPLFDISWMRTGKCDSPMASHILLVEDTPSDEWLIDRAIKTAAPHVSLTHVRNGNDAIACLARLRPFEDPAKYPRPVLVLLDLKLPGRSGLEVLTWLRSAPPPLGATPVLVLSSSEEPDDVSQAYAFGANGYLVKPATAGALKKLVERVIGFWIDANLAPLSRAS